MRERRAGPRHGRGKDRTAHRWGKTKGKIGFHGGKVEIARPRLRSFDGGAGPSQLGRGDDGRLAR